LPTRIELMLDELSRKVETLEKRVTKLERLLGKKSRKS